MREPKSSSAPQLRAVSFVKDTVQFEASKASEESSSSKSSSKR